MAKAKYDPLEAAKVGGVGPAESPPEDPIPSADKDKVPTQPLPKEFRGPVPERPKYRVVETKRLSIGGQVLTLAAGRVIDSAGYGGADGIKRLEAQGLKLELVS